jgi:molecular chaperone GrpE
MTKKKGVKSKADKKTKAEVADLENQLIRALADYDNLRKRLDSEVEERVIVAKARFLIKLLTIYDMLIDAQIHLNDSGVAIVIKEYKDLLNEEGIETIEVDEGDRFNEEVCEAVEVVNTSDKKKRSKIAEVLLSGWKFIDGPIIRPVKVKVYKK